MSPSRLIWFGVSWEVNSSFFNPLAPYLEPFERPLPSQDLCKGLSFFLQSPHMGHKTRNIRIFFATGKFSLCVCIYIFLLFVLIHKATTATRLHGQ